MSLQGGSNDRELVHKGEFSKRRKNKIEERKKDEKRLREKERKEFDRKTSTTSF